MHGSSLKYAWLSDGTKVSARADDGNGEGVQKRYLGSFVYTSNTGSSADEPTEVESVAWDEGRIFFSVPIAFAEEIIDPMEGSGGDPDPVGFVDTVAVDSLAWVSYYRDCWFAGDHLGNVRSMIDITPGLSSPQILEQNDYLPFGTKIQNPNHAAIPMGNRWRYAGKETQHFGSLGKMLHVSGTVEDCIDVSVYIDFLRHVAILYRRSHGGTQQQTGNAGQEKVERDSRRHGNTSRHFNAH